jgi:hypothetical protein
MPMSSFLGSRWLVITGNELQGLWPGILSYPQSFQGPGLYLETSWPLVPQSSEYHRMRYFCLRLYNRCSRCRIVKQPKAHPSVWHLHDVLYWEWLRHNFVSLCATSVCWKVMAPATRVQTSVTTVFHSYVGEAAREWRRRTKSWQCGSN